MASEPLMKTAKAARLNAYIYLFFGAIFAVAAIAIYVTNLDKPGGLLSMSLMSGFYLIPSCLLLFFARRLESGRVWAGIGITVLCVLILANTIVGMMVRLSFDAAEGFLLCGGVGAAFGILPCVYLAATCLNVIPELRHLRRARLRELAQNGTRGFDVIPKESPIGMQSAKLPPRPVIRSPRK